MNALVGFLLSAVLVNPGLAGPAVPSNHGSVPDTVFVIRVVEEGNEVSTPAEVEEGYAEAKGALSPLSGYVASTLYEEAYPGSPFRLVTLTSWESASHMADAAPALAGLWEAGVNIGQYSIEGVRRSEGRPWVGSYAIMVPFTSGVDRAGVLEQIQYFDEAAAQVEGWLGSVTFTAAGGDPAYDLITLSSWATLDAARRYLGSGPMVNLLIRVAQEDLIPPVGISILRMTSH